VSVLTIAIAKGRTQEEMFPLLERAGIRTDDAALRSRRLAIEDLSGRYRFVFVKSFDVPVYVEHGIADCGVVGYDVLLETEPDLLQQLDLRISLCRIVVAAPQRAALGEMIPLRVATKYPRIAARHYAAKGLSVEIIQLSGSVELAPVLGLADCIVDLVKTGRTLVENGLHEIEQVSVSTGYLVMNRARYQLKAVAFAELLASLRSAISP
jgi:ATP phosphoribosyltransferase